MAEFILKRLLFLAFVAMASRFVFFWLKKAPPAAPCTTPAAILRAKCVTLLQTYAAAVSLFLLPLYFNQRATLFSLVATGVVVFATLCLQGIALLTWTQLNAWKEPLCRRRSRLHFPARALLCLSTAFLCMSSLTTGQPILVLGGLLGVLWMVLLERHECVMRGVQHGSDMPHQHLWAACCFHIQTIGVWIKRVWKECAVFLALLLMLKSLNVVPLPQWSALTPILIKAMTLTLVWMCGVNLFHEVLNGRFYYGDYSDPKTFIKVIPSIRSDSQIAKRYGLSFLKWVVSAGNGIGQEYRKALFVQETAQVIWNGCASACCAEIDALADCIIHAVGKVPDISSPMLCAKKEAVYGIGVKIQHKYALLSRCLGCLSGMLSAAVEEDKCGSGKYGTPNIGKIMQTVFEAHFLLRYFTTTGAPFLKPSFPFAEIWAPDALLLEFERIHVAIWKYYGSNLFVQINRSPRFLSSAVLIKEIEQFTGTRTGTHGHM